MRTEKLSLLRALLCLLVLCLDLACSPRDFLTRRLAADLISTSDAFKAPQLFWLKNGIVSNQDFSSPDSMGLQHRGWIIGTQEKCPAGVDPPPCWEGVLTPLGEDTIRPLITTVLPENGPMSIQVARRDLLSIAVISKGGKGSAAAFARHWVSLNQAVVPP